MKVRTVITCLIVSVGVFARSAPAEDPVYVVDARLKAAVEERLGVSDPTPTDMLGLTSLAAPSAGITDVTGLEYATNLRTLDLHVNQISDVSALIGLDDLQTLDLNNNQISDISALSGLRHLRTLNLHMNQISNLSALSSMKDLGTLFLYSNAISDISALSGLTSLQTLFLLDNRISDISALSDLTSVQTLYLGDNQISDLSALSGLTSLRALSLIRNRISDISALSVLSSLQSLGLGNNQISDISALSAMSSLQSLSLGNNQIRDISALSALTSLRSLLVEGNPLEKQACRVSIPQIMANNPGVYVDYPPCVPRHLLISSTVGGSVMKPGEGQFVYEHVESVCLEAKADPGFVFSNWSGSRLGTQNPMLVAMSQDHQIRANFLSVSDTLYVDDGTPDDPGPGDSTVSDPHENGTSEHPLDSIQEAIEVAAEGATVMVRPGTYRENVDLLGKGIHLMGMDPNDANGTMAYPIIAGADVGPVVRFANGEDPNCRLTGFVVTEGQGRLAGGILCSKSSPSIDHCLIVGNRSSGPAGAAVYCVDSNAVFDHCTIADNDGGDGGGGLMLVNSTVALANSIVWGNTPRQVALGGGSQLSMTYTDIAGGWDGLGNLDMDPLFAQPGHWSDSSDPSRVVQPNDPKAVWVEGDYHLRSAAGRWDAKSQTWVQDAGTSPCIDAGDPNAPVGSERMPNGGLVNLGAYGGTAQASQSQV